MSVLEVTGSLAHTSHALAHLVERERDEGMLAGLRIMTSDATSPAELRRTHGFTGAAETGQHQVATDGSWVGVPAGGSAQVGIETTDGEQIHAREA